MSKLAIRGSSVPPRTCRTVAALAASAAVLIVVAAALGGRGVSPSKAERQAPKPTASGHVKREGPSVSASGAARAFVSSYVSFLYGRRDGAAVTPVGADLRQQLLGAQSTRTPAERTRTLVVRDLTINPGVGATATGNAVVDDGASPPYALSFNLSFSHQHWLVTRVEKVDR